MFFNKSFAGYGSSRTSRSSKFEGTTEEFVKRTRKKSAIKVFECDKDSKNFERFTNFAQPLLKEAGYNWNPAKFYSPQMSLHTSWGITEDWNCGLFKSFKEEVATYGDINGHEASRFKQLRVNNNDPELIKLLTSICKKYVESRRVNGRGGGRVIILCRGRG